MVAFDMNDGAGLFNGLSWGFAGHVLGGKRCKVGENNGVNEWDVFEGGFFWCNYGYLWII